MGDHFSAESGSAGNWLNSVERWHRWMNLNIIF